jgi:hypothetical protein
LSLEESAADVSSGASVVHITCRRCWQNRAEDETTARQFQVITFAGCRQSDLEAAEPTGRLVFTSVKSYA